MGRIKHLIREHVFLFNIKAFTYIEALFALFVTTLILALLPTILKLTSFYLNTAQNNEDIQFEFFRRDLLKEKMTTKNNYEIENAYTIKLKKNKDVIRYIYKNRKIYKNIKVFSLFTIFAFFGFLVFLTFVDILKSLPCISRLTT